MLWTLFIGLVVGIVAKMVMPGRDPGGVIITMCIGVVGALLAHLIGRSFGWYVEGEPAGFVASVLGAVILLGFYRLVRDPRLPH